MVDIHMSKLNILHSQMKIGDTILKYAMDHYNNEPSVLAPNAKLVTIKKSQQSHIGLGWIDEESEGKWKTFYGFSISNGDNLDNIDSDVFTMDQPAFYSEGAIELINDLQQQEGTYTFTRDIHIDLSKPLDERGFSINTSILDLYFNTYRENGNSYVSVISDTSDVAFLMFTLQVINLDREDEIEIDFAKEYQVAPKFSISSIDTYILDKVYFKLDVQEIPESMTITNVNDISQAVYEFTEGKDIEFGSLTWSIYNAFVIDLLSDLDSNRGNLPPVTLNVAFVLIEDRDSKNRSLITIPYAKTEEYMLIVDSSTNTNLNGTFINIHQNITFKDVLESTLGDINVLKSTSVMLGHYAEGIASKTANSVLKNDHATTATGINTAVMIQLTSPADESDDTVSVNINNESVLLEATSTLSSKRKKIESLIYNYMDAVDKTKANSSKYRTMFATMNDEKFISYVKNIVKDPMANSFYMEFLPGHNEPKLDEVIDGLNVLGVAKDEYVYLRHDGNQDNPIRTRYPVPVGYVQVRRMQQTREHKNNYSYEASKRNLRSGFLSGGDKVASLSGPEASGLEAVGAQAVLKELMGPRGDSMDSKNVMYQNISEDGYFSLRDLPNDLESKIALRNTSYDLLAAGLNNNLITDDDSIDFSKYTVSVSDIADNL